MKKLIWIAVLFFVSCKAPSEIVEDKVFILIDGEHVELVSDEFGNQYLKQDKLFIPFPFETEEVGDTLRAYQAKIK